jgi:hypothetical protein
MPCDKCQRQREKRGGERGAGTGMCMYESREPNECGITLLNGFYSYRRRRFVGRQ